MILFSLCNPPGRLSPFPQELFCNLLRHWTFVFLKVILIYSKIDHVWHVQALLQRLLQWACSLTWRGVCFYHYLGTSFAVKTSPWTLKKFPLWLIGLYLPPWSNSSLSLDLLTSTKSLCGTSKRWWHLSPTSPNLQNIVAHSHFLRKMQRPSIFSFKDFPLHRPCDAQIPPIASSLNWMPPCWALELSSPKKVWTRRRILAASPPPLSIVME